MQNRIHRCDAKLNLTNRPGRTFDRLNACVGPSVGVSVCTINGLTAKTYIERCGVIVVNYFALSNIDARINFQLFIVVNSYECVANAIVC